MLERNVRHVDVRHALVHARSCVEAGARWRVEGPDADGDDLSLVCAIEGGVVVVTVS